MRQHALCGGLMRTSLAVTPDGLPLGLTAVKVWSRANFKGPNALERRLDRTRIPIEAKESVRWLDNSRQSTELIGAPGRCVHIGDRESDIDELFCLARELGTNFLVRACADRPAEDGGTTIARLMRDVGTSGGHRVRFHDASGWEQDALLSVRFATMTVRPPIGKQRRHAHQRLRVVQAEEVDPPEGRSPILWKPITNLAVEDHADAARLLGLSRPPLGHRDVLQDPEVGVPDRGRPPHHRRSPGRPHRAVRRRGPGRIDWLTMLRREGPNASAAAVFTTAGIEVLDRATARPRRADEARDLNSYLIRVPRLGGRLARRCDGPPGTSVMWRGFSRLADLVAGFVLAHATAGTCGSPSAEAEGYGASS